MIHTFLHATLTQNNKAILSKGFIPQIGENSQIINEPYKAVYLFNSPENLFTALGQWFGELFNDTDDITVFFITLDTSDPHLTYNTQPHQYESTYDSTIPPTAIVKCLSEDEFYNWYQNH